ncbi:MAG: hypothetical protein F6K58_25840 [Symploca sp. SIO2E9]|nr:hypothetical protein [Symploca sp. SIO2E9]
MNLIYFAKLKNKVEQILVFFTLIFLGFGCSIRITTGNQCKEAEQVIAKVHQQYDENFQELVASPTDGNINKSFYDNFKQRQEAEEKAFEMCSKSY